MANKEQKLISYRWQAINKAGSRVKGLIQASSDAAAKAELRKQQLTQIKLSKELKLFGPAKKKIETADIAIFSRQLATMMEAGVPLVQALEIVAKGHENPSMGELISAVKTSIEGGSSLAESLAEHPLHFDDLFVNLTAAGEASGALETLLDKIATYKEKTEAIKKKVKKALTYPIAVLVVAFIVTAILLLFVVPVFEDLFQSFGADLPAFTQFTINMSQWMQANWLYLGIVMVGTGVAFSQTKKRSPTFRRFLDRISLRLPVIGPILEKSAIARFARTLSTMFSAGVPLVDALESVAKASGNIIFEEGIMEMREQVSTGTQLQLTMAQSGLFPAMATQMVAIGEESGALDGMCARVATFYEDEVDAMVDSLSSLLEPFIMAILGTLVGGLVVSMYLPIFKLGSVI
ncbi:MAG: type II secretion system F family protein [Oceanococcus sp.]